jgi:hypothetical protein
MSNITYLTTSQGMNPKEEILALIKEAKEWQELGGGEDEEGSLLPGAVDFDELYSKIEARLNILVDIQKYATYKGFRSLSTGETWHLNTVFGEIILKCIKNTIKES